jgi:hypothetical protein
VVGEGDTEPTACTPSSHRRYRSDNSKAGVLKLKAIYF